MAETPTIKEPLLNQTAWFAAGIVTSVLVNNSVVITDFIRKSSNNNVSIIEYEVFASHNLGTIKNVKLRDAFNNILAEMNVNIDNTFNVRMNHKILFEEGIDESST